MSKLRRILLAAVIIYIFLLLSPIAGFDIPRVAGIIANQPYLVLRYIVIGIANGGIFAIIALGYTLVYGIIQLINFAHGDLYMMCTFASLTIIAAMGTTSQSEPGKILITIVFALIVAVVFGGLLNAFIERVAYRRLRNAPRLAPLISAIGVSFILENLGQIWAGQGYIQFLTPYFGTSGGAAQKAYPDLVSNQDVIKDMLGLQGLSVDFLKGNEMLIILVTIILALALLWFFSKTHFGLKLRDAALAKRINLQRIILMIAGVVSIFSFVAAILNAVNIGANNGRTVSAKEVLVIAVAILLMLALRWFIANTRMGKAMRATAENRDAAKIMGINIDRIITITFLLGGGLAGAAAVLNGLYVNTAWWLMGFQAGLRSFTAAVLGGIGNIT
ncbi:MAG TPA: branched-chain amino acid ABC transporter permease, partial [Anaerolineae bacterium]|nr:branched-chain amino acid ABC transporter permease [Anaerolineae bacterium]